MSADQPAGEHEHLIGDAKLFHEFHADNFSGARYNRFLDGLMAAGAGYIAAGLKSGAVFAACRRRNASIRLSFPVGWNHSDCREVMLATVAAALIRFYDEAMVEGGWQPAGGASLTTHFINYCIDALPNELRRWSKFTHAAQFTDTLDGLEDRVDTGFGPAELAAMADELRCAMLELSRDDQQIFELRSAGYLTDEIAAIQNTTSRAIEGRIYRARKRLEGKRRGAEDE
ncbi:sigma-70 family RNA polymerase sigma factor [Actinoplanes sp. LDG1-06]|uniref:Sigma-70 family RNA polymerase sigma factor n=1 Tax=Paractinoplanes ovalisporus TaxID=2810368 RepID=A0ABS2ANZ1_9ACTN|nr:sigma-70 family RNA polymerase sigma factor [Actinoplanes ovalisporus]MBM2620929.1 sigma-70 family RNA polymerase sigma factor [Actinoplanes ovalisporus]